MDWCFLTKKYVVVVYNIKIKPRMHNTHIRIYGQLHVFWALHSLCCLCSIHTVVVKVFLLLKLPACL